MIAAGWFPSHVLAEPGSLGTWGRVLGGSITPCARVDLNGRRLLYLVGAEGRRADGGPAWRRLGVLDLDTGKAHPVIERFPNSDDEEGCFTCAPILDGDRLRMFVGEVVMTSPGVVDVQTVEWTSHDGLAFERRRPWLGGRGEEVGPLAAYMHGARAHVYHYVRERSGWHLDWQLACDDGPVSPRISALGATGPFPLPGGRMALLVIPDPGDRRLMPVPQFYSFAPADPWTLRAESWPVPPCAFHCAIGPNGTAYTLDSRDDRHARLLVCEPGEAG